MTSYVPLLTVFTPPASCSDNSYTLDESDIYMKDINLESTDCYPDGFKDVWSASQPFSPGLCPDAYSRASYNIAPWAMSGEVMEWLCCPGGMFASGNGYSCYTTVASETELALPTGTLRQQNLIIAVHGVYVAIASSDASLIHTQEPAPSSASTLAPRTSSPASQSILSTSAPASTRSFSTAIQTFSQSSGFEGDITSTPPSPQRTTTSSPSSPSTPPPSPSRTTIGIAVGLSATLALLATLLAIAMIRRKRRRKRASTYSNPVNVRVFDTASEFNEDKRKWWWSPLSLSPASPVFDRRHSHAEIVGPEKKGGGDGRGLGIEEVQEADSRCVGNRELGDVQEADSRCVSREVGAAQEADPRCVSREIAELQGD